MNKYFELKKSLNKDSSWDFKSMLALFGHSDAHGEVDDAQHSLHLHLLILSVLIMCSNLI
jgi:hypothetical protein